MKAHFRIIIGFIVHLSVFICGHTEKVSITSYIFALYDREVQCPVSKTMKQQSNTFHWPWRITYEWIILE